MKTLTGVPTIPRSFLLHGLVLAALLALAPGARATPVEWTLADVLFDDGGTAAGSFIYDADTDIFSAINISTSAGSFFAGAVYGELLFGGATDAAFVSGALPDYTGEPLLQLIFQTPLTSAGGLVGLVDLFFPVASSFEATCTDGPCFGAFFERSLVDGGLVGVVIPIPAAGLLLPGALVVLAFARRRKLPA